MKKLIDLYLREVPAADLDAIERLGAAMRPPIKRNDLLRFWISEIASGRLELVEKNSAGEEAA